MLIYWRVSTEMFPATNSGILHKTFQGERTTPSVTSLEICQLGFVSRYRNSVADTSGISGSPQILFLLFSIIEVLSCLFQSKRIHLKVLLQVLQPKKLGNNSFPWSSLLTCWATQNDHVMPSVMPRLGVGWGGGLFQGWGDFGGHHRQTSGMSWWKGEPASALFGRNVVFFLVCFGKFVDVHQIQFWFWNS